MKKNDEFIITIEDMTNDGEGIGHLPPEDAHTRGIAVFVKGTVVGDIVRMGLTKIKKSYAYGRLIEVLEPSPHRVTPRCANARRCGGCTLMQMAYEKQLDYKMNKVRSCLKRIGGIPNADVLTEAVYGMDEPYGYRNKMQFPVGVSKDGNIQIGFYAGHTHSIIDTDECVIGHPVNGYLLKTLRPFFQQLQDETGNFVYDEESHTGVLRHVLTRVGFATGELMVCFVINAKKLPTDTDALVSRLQEAVQAYNTATNKTLTLASVCVNHNLEKTNRILGDTCHTIWGSDTITDYIGNVKFSVSPLSFYQVNPVQTKVLYEKAAEYASLTGTETVWDMYCGIGTISLFLAQRAKKVYGVEVVPQAIADAKRNAAENGLTNTEFFCGKAETVVPEFYASAADEAGCHPDVVVVDPPRKGCDGTLLDTIARMNPRRMVYVSCDPATLARDIKILTEKGFILERVAVVDQFSHTNHTEVCCLLSNLRHAKAKADTYVKFGVEAEDYCRIKDAGK